MKPLALTLGASLGFVFAHAHLTDRALARSLASDDQPQALVLVAAPQDAHVFTTWSPAAGAVYSVRWKVATGGPWHVVDAGSATSRAVTGLANGVTYLFQVQAALPDGTSAFSSVIAATPRLRPNCVALDYYPWVTRVSLFCTKEALDAYLSQLGVSPFALRCRQIPVTAWNEHSPDCLYTAPSGEQLLLLRSADVLFAGANQYPLPSDVRYFARRAIWGSDDPFSHPRTAEWIARPFPVTGNVTRHAEAYSFQIGSSNVYSRVTWFVPRAPVSGRFSIYHEGHGGAGVEIGAETIDWLLDRGWHVISVDMPLLGQNSVDAGPGLQAHGQFDAFDTGVLSPAAYFLAPLPALVDRILEQGGRDLLLIGRSGGGLTAYLYAAVDPRIDVAVSVAGGRPISERLDAPWGAAELGDYEQTVPYLYDAVGHEHLMLAAGSKGSFYIYNRWDGCCFRIQPGSAFVQYLVGAFSALGRSIAVFVDEENPAHSIGPRGYVELERYLQGVRWGGTRPDPPANMRIVR